MKKFFRYNAIILFFFASAVMVFLLFIYAINLMLRASDMLEFNTRQRLLAVSKLAAQQVTVEELEQFQSPEDMESPLYGEIKQRLADFSEENQVMYTYYLRPKDGVLQFVVDNDFDPETMVGLEDTAAIELAPEKALNGQAAAAGVGDYSQDWDGILAAFAPVYAADGSVYCVAGVDISDEEIVHNRDEIRILFGMQIAVLCVTVVIGILGLAVYRNMAAQADEANRAKSQFLSRMSHEIRTPMNAITGLSRMAKETEDPQQIHAYLDDITTSSNHLLRLIDDILDLSKIESGKIVFDTRVVDTRAEIDNIVRIIQPQLRAKDQHFTLQVDPAIPPYMRGDSTHVRQVAVNLLSNAVKFTPEGGHISLSIRLLEQRGEVYNLEWRVKDDGIGIAQQFLGKLFDPFEQGDGSTTRKYGGSGLGLAISKQLVNMMDGDIAVTSELGKGSEFVYNLQLEGATEQDMRDAEPPTPAGSVDLTDQTILLVEDSEINRLIAQNLFEGMGAEVDLAENGLEGVTMFKMHPQRYNYIFMDIQMPVMDGYEATREIRESGAPGSSTIPIIAMTANVFREDVQQALNAGMNAHVGKPFEVEQIIRAILLSRGESDKT